MMWIRSLALILSILAETCVMNSLVNPMPGGYVTPGSRPFVGYAFRNMMDYVCSNLYEDNADCCYGCFTYAFTTPQIDDAFEKLVNCTSYMNGTFFEECTDILTNSEVKNNVTIIRNYENCIYGIVEDDVVSLCTELASENAANNIEIFRKTAVCVASKLMCLRKDPFTHERMFPAITFVKDIGMKVFHVPHYTINQDLNGLPLLPQEPGTLKPEIFPGTQC